MQKVMIGEQLKVPTASYLTKYLFAIFLLFVALSPGQAQAQQKLDLSIPSVRSAYVGQLAEEGRQAKAQAEAWAMAHGIPIRHDDGTQVIELMYLDNGRPVYNITQNVDAAISVATDMVRNTAPYNLNGSGMAVGIWDGGGVLSTHQEFGGRVTIKDGAASHYHSTHVGGTIGAAGVVASALGMAPSVNIDSYEWTNDASEMAGRGASYAGEPDKIYVSNHSYSHISGWVYTDWSGTLADHWSHHAPWNGASSVEENFGQYDSTTRTYDEVAYNAPYYLIFKSAGNDRNDNPSAGTTVYYSTNGGASWNSISYSTSTCPPGDGLVKSGFDTIPHRGVAKNLMTVGSVNDAVSGGSRYLPNATMSSFSGWGPADDGRIKPDIVGNGASLYSADNGNNADYRTLSGTSMSSPNASGSAILLVEYYGELFPGQAMLSSTLKGVIIHTADDLGNPGPDYSYGWGLMNTEAAAALIKEHYDLPLGNRIVEAVLNGSNPTDSYNVQWDGTDSLRVTLCWTDPPASTITSHNNTSPRLINDLDIRITGPGGSPTYYPYILDPVNPSFSATTGDNTLDNVEQIYISATGVAGTYVLEVSHKGILTNGTQDYSIIMFAEEYNCCPATISSYPYSENFEGETACSEGCGDPCPLSGHWINYDGDDHDWTVDSDGTTSNPTGPSVDHNPGTSDGKYLYTESSSACSNSEAILLGPCFDLSSLSNPELRFWYHMYGSNMGTLTVELSDDNCASWIPVWTLSGDQGNAWYGADVDLSAYAGSTITIRFKGLTGSSFLSDMAIDDITLASYLPVPDVVGMTEANAATAITGAGLVVGTVTYACSDTVASGDVISQDPISGTSVPAGSSVDIVVSTGQPTVPDVTGMDEASAIAAINAVNYLSVGDVTYEYSMMPEGNVISQNPTVGFVPCDSTVNLVISNGPLLSDNFDDNIRSAMWRTLRNGLNDVWIIEDANQLNVRSIGGDSYQQAAYITNGWSIDVSADFQMKVDFHFSGTDPNYAWAGITVEKGDDYAMLAAGTDSGAAYYYADANSITEKISRASDDGTLYVSYDSALDELYLSYTGYGFSNSWKTISGLLGASGSVDVIIGGGTDGVILTSGKAYLDNFELSTAALLGWPPATDLDADGFIGLGDLLVLADYWLGISPEGQGDITDDGNVDLKDFTELYKAW